VFIRYNTGIQFWEYDTSPGQTGAGPWIVLPISGAYIIGGTIPLPPNVAYIDRINNFVGGQVIDGSLRLGVTVNAALLWSNPALGADLKRWHQFTTGAGGIQFYPVNDAETVPLNQGIIFSRSGRIDAVGDIVAGGGALGSYLRANGNNSQIQMFDPNSPVNQKTWRFVSYNNGNLYLESTTDALATISQHIFQSDGIAVFQGPYVQAKALYIPGPESSNPLLLDDYEEGNWTPSFQGDGAEATGQAYDIQQGIYTKIGRQVTVTCDVSITNVGTGGAGNLILKGFPYMNVGVYTGGTIGYYINFTIPVYNVLVYMGASNAISYFNYVNVASPGINGVFTYAHIQPGTRVMVTFTYQIP
jgi:hypothetical protein